MCSWKQKLECYSIYQVVLLVSIIDDPSGYLQHLFFGIHFGKSYDIETSLIVWTIPPTYLNDLMGRYDLDQLRSGSDFACLLPVSIAAADQSYT